MGVEVIGLARRQSIRVPRRRRRKPDKLSDTANSISWSLGELLVLEGVRLDPVPREPRSPRGIVSPDGLNQLDHPAQVRLGRVSDLIAFLPIAGLLGSSPRHCLTDLIGPTEMDEAQRAEGLLQRVDVCLMDCGLDSAPYACDRAPHDPRPEDVVRGHPGRTYGPKEGLVVPHVSTARV